MKVIHTGLPGRPRIMKETVRVIIQMEAETYEQVKEQVKDKKSISQFFREAVDAALTTK